jgi:hypothetical protein
MKETKKVFIVLVTLLFFPGCMHVQTSNIPQTFNYPPKITLEKIGTQVTPIFIDEINKIFIVKDNTEGVIEIKSGRSISSLKSILKGDGKLYINMFDEKIMYFAKDDGAYLSEDSGRTFRQITDSSMKITSMGFNYNGDVFAVVNCYLPTKSGYFLYRVVDKDKLVVSSAIGEGSLFGGPEFIFNPENPEQFILNNLITSDGGKTFIKSDKLSGSPCAFNPYNVSEIYEYLGNCAPILLVDINSEAFQWQKIYPLNPITTYQNFEQFYTDFEHKITYGIDNYNTLFAFIDSKVFKIAKIESDTQLKMEFINRSNEFYRLPLKGSFYYKVKILGEDRENNNIGVVKANVEIPKTNYEVSFSDLKSEDINIKQGVVHCINAIEISNDAFAYIEVESKPDMTTQETLKLYDMNTGNTKVISVADSSELKFDVNGQINNDWLLYSTILQKGRDDTPLAENSLKIYAYNRKLGKIKLILQFSDIEKIFSENLNKNFNFDVIKTKLALSGDTAFVAINGSISENFSGRINYVSSCAGIFKFDLPSNYKSVLFKEIAPVYDTREITRISANSEYMAFSYAGQDNVILYLYSISNKSLEKILEARGYDVMLTEDNSLIFEDGEFVYIASIESLDKKVPVVLEDTLLNCAVSTDYIAYPHDYEETNLVNGMKTYAYHLGTEIYNRITHTKSLIKDCFFYNAYINEDTLVIFGCDSKNPNMLHLINLKENGF